MDGVFFFIMLAQFVHKLCKKDLKKESLDPDAYGLQLP